MNPQALGYLLSAGALVSFATATLATQRASALMPLSLGFLVATGVNVLFASLALLVRVLVHDAPVGWDSVAFGYFIVAGILATYLGRWFFYESVLLFGPAKASIFQVSNPLFTALIAWVALSESLAIHVLVAMCMAVGGLLIISVKPRPAKPAAAAPRVGVWPGVMQSILFLGMGSSLAYGASNVLRAAAIRDWGEPILGGLLGAASGLLMHLLFMKDKQALIERVRAANRTGLWMYVVIGVATISGQIFTIGAMRYIPVSVATLVTLCTPLLVIPLSRLIYKDAEPITTRLVLGTALTLVGVMVVVLR